MNLRLCLKSRMILVYKESFPLFNLGNDDILVLIFLKQVVGYWLLASMWGPEGDGSAERDFKVPRAGIRPAVESRPEAWRVL